MRGAKTLVLAGGLLLVGVQVLAPPVVAAAAPCDRAERLATFDTLAQKGSPPTPAVAGFEGADALWNAGYKTEGREQARKVAIEKGIPIPGRFTSPRPSIASQVKDQTADVATYGSALVIVLVVVASGIALLWKIWSGLARRRFVNLGTFTTHPAGSDTADAGAGSKTDTASSGEVLKAVVAEELADASQASSTFQVVDASAVDLPDFLEVPEQLKPVGKLLQVLFRRSVLTLSATARELEGRTWQVTAQLATRRRVKRQVTFEVPSSAGGHASAVGTFIAAWAMVAMRGLIGRPWHRPTHPLGTTSWMSLATMRLATRSKGRKVEELIHRSLARDHRNALALARLGRMQILSPDDAGQVSAGLEHLELATKMLASRPTQRPRWIRGRPHRAHVQWEPLWFQVSYARTISVLVRYYKAPDPGELRAALTEALGLAEAIADTWLSVHGRWRRFAVTKTRREELVTMLDVDDQYYLGLLAGALVEGVVPPPSPAPCTPRVGRALWEWVAGFEKQRDLGELLTLATTPSSHASIGTRYNIACVWTRIGRFDEALESLRAMFSHVVGEGIPAMVDQVKEDATLDPLRGHPVHLLTLETMLAEVEKRGPQEEPNAPATPAKAGRWTVEVLTR